MNPTPLVSGARKDLLDRPEAEPAVADRARNLEATQLDVDEKVTPALCALSHSGLEAEELLLALGCCADQHQHAFGGFFHPGLQIDPVGDRGGAPWPKRALRAGPGNLDRGIGGVSA